MAPTAWRPAPHLSPQPHLATTVGTWLYGREAEAPELEQAEVMEPPSRGPVSKSPSLIPASALEEQTCGTQHRASLPTRTLPGQGAPAGGRAGGPGGPEPGTGQGGPSRAPPWLPAQRLRPC